MARAKSSFCWFPPESVAAGASRSREPLTFSRDSRDVGALASPLDEPEPRPLGQAREADVLADRATEEQAVVLARFRDHRHAGAKRVLGRADQLHGPVAHLPGGPGASRRRWPARAPIARPRSGRRGRRSPRRGPPARRPGRRGRARPGSRARPGRRRPGGAWRDRPARSGVRAWPRRGGPRSRPPSGPVRTTRPSRRIVTVSASVEDLHEEVRDEDDRPAAGSERCGRSRGAGRSRPPTGRRSVRRGR